jgi:hypothetical protein
MKKKEKGKTVRNGERKGRNGRKVENMNRNISYLQSLILRTLTWHDIYSISDFLLYFQQALYFLF